MRLLPGFLLLLATLAGATGWVCAAPAAFDLPAQPGDQALLAFARQTRLEVLFAAADLRAVRSTAVAGTMEPDEALAALLAGTGFRAERDGRGAYRITGSAWRSGLSGRLLRPDGRPAAGAVVILGGTRRQALSEADGRFRFDGLAPGTYDLAATADGCQPLRRSDLRITTGRELPLGWLRFERAGDLAQLSPFLVQDDSDGRRTLDRSAALHRHGAPAGNLDLRRTEDGPLPYTLYDRAQILRSGVVNLNEFLQRELLDSDASTRPPEQDGTQPSYVSGSRNLSLRGYAADETVVLVNGRRLPEIVLNGSASLPPDVNVVPLSLVHHVEVLPISASALYTGNPVGGVINIVLRPGGDAAATEVTTTYTNVLRGYDAPQMGAALLHSRTLLGGTLRVRLNLSLSRSQPPTESELGYLQARASFPLSLRSPVFRATPNVRSADLSSLFGPGTPPVTSVAPGADGRGGLAAFAGREGMPSLDFFRSPGGLASSLESADFPYGRKQRQTVWLGSAAYEPVPWLQLTLEGSVARTAVNRGYVVFPADLTLAATSPLNPFRRALLVSLNETAPRLGEGYAEGRLVSGALALGAVVRLPHDWRLTLEGQYARNVNAYRGLWGADAGRWQALVDAGRYQPLRDTRRHGPPDEFYDRVLIYRQARGEFARVGDYETWDGALRVSREGLRLPTGLGTVNAGVDYRRNRLAPAADERRYGDGLPAAAPVQWAGRTLRRYSLFSEWQAPLWPAGALPPGLRAIDGDVAARYAASDLAAESNLAPTVGLRLELAHGLTLRGTLTRSSRFPNPNLSRQVVAAGPSAGAPEPVLALDPIRNQTYPVLATEATDPGLRPEAAVTRTAGLGWRGGRTHRLRLGLDYLDTHKVNELVFLSPQTVLILEPLWPGRVRRAPLERGDTRRAGVVTEVLTGTTNIAWRHSRNWNASLQYAWTRCAGGVLEATARVLYFQQYERQLYPTTPVVDELRQPDGTAPGLLRYRASVGLAWSNRHLGFGVEGRYFHSRRLPFQEWTSQGSSRIDAFRQFDPFVQGDLSRWLPAALRPEGLRLQLRVNNVLGTPYPAYANEPTGAGIQPYGDWRGRSYSLSLTTAF